MAKKAAATPDYLSNISFMGPQGQQISIQPPDLSGLPQNWSPQTTALVQQYFAPGGQFQQSLSGAPGSEMMPTGQGGYVPNPTYVDPTTTTPGPIDYPVPVLPNQNFQPPAAPPPPPPPPAASMNWSGLASSLQSLLAPYLSGASNPGAAGNPMAQFMPQLMSSLGGYLGTLQPTAAGQQAAASQTPLGTQTTPQPTMNWAGLGQQLQNLPGTGTGQQTQGQLLNSLLGYLGSMPSAQTTPTG